VGLSERLVAASAPLTARANVVNATRVENLTASELSTRYGLAADVGVRVDLDDRTVVSAGDPTGGTTVERIVLVNRRVTRTITPPLADTRAVTLPRRAPNATLRLRPPANTTVRSVRANDRIVLRNTSGLNGTFRIDLSRYRTTTFRLVATGDLPTGSVSITYRPSLTRKAQLAVTVDG
jgi:hypothetical protein